MRKVVKTLVLTIALHVAWPFLADAQVTLPTRIGPNSPLSPQLDELLADRDEFGASVAALGNLDGDGWIDLAVGAPGTDEEGSDRGCVYLLFLDNTARVSRVVKVGNPNSAFGSSDRDRFGDAVANLGDTNSDGRPEIAVGAPGYNFDEGAVWIFSLESSGEIYRTRRISASEIDQLDLDRSDQFGKSVANAGNLDGYGEVDLFVGVPGAGSGGIWTILQLDSAPRAVWSPPDFVDFPIPTDASFGRSVASGDIDGNGTVELLVGAPLDEINGETVGSVRVGEIGRGGELGSQSVVFHGARSRSRAGAAVTTLGDLDGNGFVDIAVGSPGYSTRRGDVDIVYLGPGFQMTLDSSIVRSASLELSNFDLFGSSLVGIPDVDGDERPDLIVGSPGWGPGKGSIWVVKIPRAPIPTIEKVSISPAEPPSTDGPIRIVASASDPQKATLSLRVHLRLGGDRDFFSIPMTEVKNGVFEVTVPEEVVSSRGLEYFVEGRNVIGFTSKKPSKGYFSLPLRIASGVSTVVRHGDAATAYRLVSFPLELERPSARQLLQSQLGSYDPKRWRFFHLAGSNSSQTVELSRSDIEIRQGSAYWLIVKDRDRTVTTGPGTTARTDAAFVVPLRAGYNLIGNPFDFVIPLEALSTTGDRDLDVWAYDEGWQSESRGLKPFQGYAIGLRDTLARDTLLIDPGVARAQTGSTLAINEKHVDVRFGVAIGAFKGRASDVENYALLTDLGSTGADGLDRYEPPRIGDYVALGFERAQTDDTSSVLLSTDAKPFGADTTVWHVVVSAGSAGAVDLQFEFMDGEPQPAAVWLIDDDAAIVQDLSGSSLYRLAVNEPSLTRRLKLVHSPGAETPSLMGLDPGAADRIVDVFPNPFDVATTIRYSIAEPGHVTLAAYDILGRRVRVILDVPDHRSGVYAAVWDGKSSPTATGAYLLTLRVDKRPVTSRLVTLVR